MSPNKRQTALNNTTKYMSAPTCGELKVQTGCKHEVLRIFQGYLVNDAVRLHSSDWFALDDS